MRHTKLIEFEKKFVLFNKRFTESMSMYEGLKNVPRVIERIVPLMTHFQICEALRKTLSDVCPTKIKEFESFKLNELNHFMSINAEKETNMQLFGARIKTLASAIQNLDGGMLPLVMGKDVFPGQTKEAATSLNVFEKLAINDRLKKQALECEESTYESIMEKLQEIQKEKQWSKDEVGKQFASLLTKEAPAAAQGDFMNQMQFMSK